MQIHSIEVFTQVCVYRHIDRHILCGHVTVCVRVCVSGPHPTVFAVIEYLWGEGVPRSRPRFLRNVLPHPLPVVFIGRYVTLLKLNLIGRQESHHILLLFLNLEGVKGGGGGRESRGG